MRSLPSAIDAWLGGATYAHRGRHGGGVIENTPEAFAAAIAAGLGIECDVQLTADDRALVFHDFALDRLTRDHGPVRARRADELAGIPLLEDLLALVGGRVPLLIEVKTRRMWPWQRLCAATALALADYRGQFAVMSFDPRVSRWFARHAPDMPRGLVWSSGGRRGTWLAHGRLAWSRAQFLAHDIADLDHRFVTACRLPRASWTIRSRADRDCAAARGTAAIAEGDGIQGVGA
jgi:glycerophosphoryl diester phosphodiesterase